MSVEHESPITASPWFMEAPDPSARRRRKHALADALRDLITDVLRLDVEQAEETALDEAEETLTLAGRRIAALPRVPWGVEGADLGSDGSLFERSPLSGRSNALATPLIMSVDGERTVAHATYPGAYEGPPGCVHGGHVIAAFDDVLGVAQSASGTAGLTGTLSVRLLRPTPLFERIDYEAGVLKRDGRKVEAWGRSTHGGHLLAEATAIFIAPRSSGTPTEPS